MAVRANNFELRLLTSSKEVGLRRLRSYAAALGGGASIFHSYEDLRKSLDGCEGSPFGYHVVLTDSTVEVTPPQMAALQKKARVFVLEKPVDVTDLPHATEPCWQVESYFRCSLQALLDSPVVRMSVAQMMHRDRAFRLAHMLRWGHAQSQWLAGDATSIADHGLAFVRGLSLAGEGRRLAEMFTHFLQTSVGRVGLSPERVTFGSDGLLLTVIAECREPQGLVMRDVADELAVNSFPIAVVNRLPDSSRIEIAALHYPFASPEILAERILMVFSKDAQAALRADVPPPEKKAG